jgi:hypothetical protein
MVCFMFVSKQESNMFHAFEIRFENEPCKFAAMVLTRTSRSVMAHELGFDQPVLSNSSFQGCGDQWTM